MLYVLAIWLLNLLFSISANIFAAIEPIRLVLPQENPPIVIIIQHST